MWHIESKKLNRIAELPAFEVLSFGCDSSCEVRLPHLKQSVAFQAMFEGAIVFLSYGEQVRSHFLSAEVSLPEDTLVLRSQNTLTIFQEHRVEDETLSLIFQTPEYKRILRFVQNAESKNVGKHLEGENKELHHIHTALKALDEFFWQERHSSEKRHRMFAINIIWAVWAQMCRYGIITHLLSDSSISEVMANDPKKIYIERSGKLELTQLEFENEIEMLGLVERVAAQGGRRIDQSIPYCDTHLPDGSRVHAIIPPLALQGPCLTIRKFPQKKIQAQTLVELGSVNEVMVEKLKELVGGRNNILISGGTGSGKTTLLNVLSSFIPPSERVITIEDSAELQLQQPHVIRLESRIANVEGKGEVSLRDLVKNALRMRPDRIVVGECRSGEALDMLQAMNTGHDGSMTTTHANSPRDALRRVETLVLFSGLNLPSRAIREQIASAVHYVVQQTRYADGKRRISSVHKVLSIDEETNQFQTQCLIEYDVFAKVWKGAWMC